MSTIAEVYGNGLNGDEPEGRYGAAIEPAVHAEVQHQRYEPCKQLLQLSRSVSAGGEPIDLKFDGWSVNAVS